MNVYGIAVVGEGLQRIEIEGTEKKFYKLEDIRKAQFAVYPRRPGKQEADRMGEPTTQSEGMPVLKPEDAAKQQQRKIDSYKRELEEFKNVLNEVEEYAAELAKGDENSRALYEKRIKPLLEGFFKGARQSTKVELKELLEGIRKNEKKKVEKPEPEAPGEKPQAKPEERQNGKPEEKPQEEAKNDEQEKQDLLKLL